MAIGLVLYGPSLIGHQAENCHLMKKKSRILLALDLGKKVLVANRNSIRGFVGPLVRRSVGHAFFSTAEKASKMFDNVF